MVEWNRSTDCELVYIVEDDGGVRDALLEVMRAGGFEVRGFGSGEDFLREADWGRGVCVVLDLRMGGMDGIEVLARMRGRGCDWPVVVVSGQADVRQAVEAMKLGAWDVLEKPAGGEAVLRCVREAMAGGRTKRRRGEEMRGARERLARLSGRERELLRLLIGGKSNKQIAAELGISGKTVEHHRASLMAKTQAANVAELVRIGVVGRMSDE